jgi:hypothetical protein
MVQRKLLIAFVCLISLVFLLLGCNAANDIRSELEKRVVPGEGLQQTQFAYIGIVESPDGPLYVATQRLVLTGMPAPRGQAWLHVFDADRALVRSYSLANLPDPLWCEGTKIYCAGFGYCAEIPPDDKLIAIFGWPGSETERGYPTGNVIDFANGATSPVMRREKRYGSSGGVDDDPFVLP